MNEMLNTVMKMTADGGVTTYGYNGRGLVTPINDQSGAFGTPEDGPLGYGWTTPWNLKVVDGDTYVDSDGWRFTFKKDAEGNFLADTLHGLALLDTGSGYEVREKGGFVYTFDIDGKLSSRTDENGNTVTAHYDAEGKLASIKDAAGREVFTFVTDANGRITSVTDIAGRTVSYAYDGLGDMTSFTDAEGKVGTYTYNAFHGLETKTNPLGEKYAVTYEYPDTGVAGSVTDPAGKVKSFQYVGWAVPTNNKGIYF